MYKPKDSFYYKAKREGYPARSVYKLEEIDKKYNLIKKGAKILELGASPGSWLKYCLSKIGKGGRIVAIDLTPPSITLPPQVNFIVEDIFKIDAQYLREVLSSSSACPGCETFDLILSDLAPKTSGMKEVDQARSLGLAKRAVGIARETVKKGGGILVKIFESRDAHDLKKEVSLYFSKTYIERPKATRRESSEFYLVGIARI